MGKVVSAIFVTQETSAKMVFIQRMLLFSNQFSDYGATKISVYSTYIVNYKFSICQAYKPTCIAVTRL